MKSELIPNISKFLHCIIASISPGIEMSKLTRNSRSVELHARKSLIRKISVAPLQRWILMKERGITVRVQHGLKSRELNV